ncbi:MAG: hypothetical protein KME42_19915 [Tildeniella nuda ZEHNDER 1965/U140]|jgi:hypothetical protein|nr:hypothetical protein [Tildeniella nuda ZEHNDER 1965/U140]
MSETKVADPEFVNNRESFFAFVQALIDDREAAIEQEKLSPSCSYSPNVGGWENVSDH